MRCLQWMEFFLFNYCHYHDTFLWCQNLAICIKDNLRINKFLPYTTYFSCDDTVTIRKQCSILSLISFSSQVIQITIAPLIAHDWLSWFSSLNFIIFIPLVLEEKKERKKEIANLHPWIAWSSCGLCTTSDLRLHAMPSFLPSY